MFVYSFESANASKKSNLECAKHLKRPPKIRWWSISNIFSDEFVKLAVKTITLFLKCGPSKNVF